MNGCRTLTKYYGRLTSRAHKQLARAFEGDRVPNKVAGKLFVEIKRACLPPAAEFVHSWGGDTKRLARSALDQHQNLARIHNPLLNCLKDGKAFSLILGAPDVCAALHYFRVGEVKG